MKLFKGRKEIKRNLLDKLSRLTNKYASATQTNETLESASCTGMCQSFKNGLPDCEKCSQFINREKKG